MAERVIRPNGRLNRLAIPETFLKRADEMIE
jgi:hypothetical protein